MKQKVAIIDYGIGNVRSVKESLEQLDCNVTISNDQLELQKADALILPGVGAYQPAMENLRTRNLINILRQLVLEDKKPIMGICLGMQLLADYSEENGHHEGLGWIPGKVIRFEDTTIRVPHVGWNNVSVEHAQPLFSRIHGEANFYFDHSYHMIPADAKHVSATVQYGAEVVAAVQKENIYGVQFHPEKSQLTGLRLMKGFLNSVISNA